MSNRGLTASNGSRQTAAGVDIGTFPHSVVFVGPSARLEDRPRGGAIDWRGPIRRGDLHALAKNVHCVGIVDGEFDQSLAVAPREILDLLHRNVIVVGAASMGALRAAELHDAGMRGVGRIFEMYRDADVTADDEVALIFDPESLRPLSEPLVNIRCALQWAIDEEVVTPAAARVILDVASALPYPQRCYRRILAEAGARFGKELAPLEPLLARHDQKRLDARLLFEHVLEASGEGGRP